MGWGRRMKGEKGPIRFEREMCYLPDLAGASGSSEVIVLETGLLSYRTERKGTIF